MKYEFEGYAQYVVCQKNTISEYQKLLAFLFGKNFELRKSTWALFELQIPKFEHSTLKYTWDITINLELQNAQLLNVVVS